MEHIPAREACTYWTDNGDVEIFRVGDRRALRANHHPKSGGACWGFWQEASPEELYFRLLQHVWSLVIANGVDPVKVHAAFMVVPEYRLMLPTDHPDYLTEDEAELVEQPLPKFSPGYNIFA